jgi:hypothetical protein
MSAPFRQSSADSSMASAAAGVADSPVTHIRLTSVPDVIED